MTTNDSASAIIARSFNPGWSFEDCGCTAPEAIHLLPHGGVLAVYSDEPSVPYASLGALVSAHTQGGEKDEAALLDAATTAMADAGAFTYEPGELFATYRAALRYYGQGSVRDGYAEASA